MKRKTVIIIASAATLLTTAAAIGTTAYASRNLRHAAYDRICGEERNERVDRALQHARIELQPKPDQTAAWDAFVLAVNDGSARVGETCATLGKSDREQTPPERLARMQTIMATGLDVVSTVQPAFENLYAVLDDKQKARVDEFVRRHRGHHDRSRHHDRDRDDHHRH